MTIDDKVLYARIVDPNGLTDGLQGYAIGFELAADREELKRLVGAELEPSYVEAPNAHCAGWRYENGGFVPPPG
jgi:hypothetical protein